jgi:NAD(P)-dependent dehydrogenase (short-subunit alcohol dehydrogenase family)
VVYKDSAAEAATLAREIEGKGRKCISLKRDLRDVEQCGSVIRDVRDALGAPTLLLNNASIFERGPLRATTIEAFDANFAVHARAPFILTRDFANLAENGLIVNMLDTRVTRNRTTYFAYLLSKKTLSEMTKIAAFELAPKIRVNAIAPGFVLPSENSPENAEIGKRVPAGRQGAPNDVASALEFFVKNEFVTGETIFVDGGEHL